MSDEVEAVPGEGAAVEVSGEAAAGGESVDAAAEAAALRDELVKRAAVQEELEKKLASAKSQEDFDRVVSEHTAEVERLNLSLAHSHVMRRYGLSDDLAEFVFGASEEEMAERAERLRARVAPAGGGTSRSGGGVGGASVGSASSLPDDPGELASLVPRGGLRSL